LALIVESEFHGVSQNRQPMNLRFRIVVSKLNVLQLASLKGHIVAREHAALFQKLANGVFEGIDDTGSEIAHSGFLCLS
jgi:hypothetical protein